MRCIEDMPANVVSRILRNTDASTRSQINQLLNWHWQLKTQAGEPELISGWRGELMAERLKRLLNDYPR